MAETPEPPTTVDPFMYQTTRPRVVVFSNSKSGQPSPLKSATPTTLQPEGTVLLIFVTPVREVPCINHTSSAPVDAFSRSRSGGPALSKSPEPTTLHPVGSGEETTPPPIRVS